VSDKTKAPPTKRQLERLNEYISHPAVTPHLDSLMTKLETHLKTVGGTGVLLHWLKGEINEYNKRNSALIGEDMFGNVYSSGGISLITSAWMILESNWARKRLASFIASSSIICLRRGRSNASIRRVSAEIFLAVSAAEITPE
jgi:hypothetical protein